MSLSLFRVRLCGLALGSARSRPAASIDVCAALDEIDCPAWGEFWKPCQENLETKFGRSDFSGKKGEGQCKFIFVLGSNGLRSRTAQHSTSPCVACNAANASRQLRERRLRRGWCISGIPSNRLRQGTGKGCLVFLPDLPKEVPRGR